jgi:pimeloyl-ACP methyl ester carboxylesterase
MGESPPVGAELTVRAMATDVIELMDTLGIERGDVIGWSMGGFIAQEVAAAVPDRVDRLVLLSTDHGGPGAVNADPATWARLVDHAGTPREQATRMLSLLFPAELAVAIDAEFGELVAQARAALSPTALDAQERAIDRWHDEPADGRLGAITAAALIACGAEDVVIPASNTGLLADALPGSGREIFAGGGHAFMAQEPVRLAGTVNAWLGR